MKKEYCLIVLSIILVSLIFFACEDEEDEEDPLIIDEPASLQTRIQQFLYDLNNDTNRNAIYRNLHSSIESAYRSGSAWSGEPFRVENIEFSFNLSYASNTASGTMSHNYDSNRSIEFEFLQDGDNWKISKITESSIQVIPNP
jgi:hypothetical protein